MNVGSSLQQDVHYLGVTILRGHCESCASILSKTIRTSSVSVLLTHHTLTTEKHLVYLCVELSRGAKLKEQLHHIMVSLLGGQEQSCGTCLQRKIKNNYHVFLLLKMTSNILNEPHNNVCATIHTESDFLSLLFTLQPVENFFHLLLPTQNLSEENL